MKQYLLIIILILSAVTGLSAQYLRSFEEGVLQLEHAEFATHPFEIPVMDMNSDEIAGYLPAYFEKKTEQRGDDEFCTGEKTVTYSSVDGHSVLHFVDCEYELLYKIELQENALPIRYDIRLGQAAEEVLRRMKVSLPGMNNPIESIVVHDESGEYVAKFVFRNRILVQLIYLPAVG